MAAASIPNSSGWSEEHHRVTPREQPSDSIRAILEEFRTLAVVGLSSKTSRPSFGVAAYMQAHGYRIIPVNPNETCVLGERACHSLEEIPETPEVVVIFRRPEHVPEVVESAIRKGAKVV